MIVPERGIEVITSYVNIRDGTETWRAVRFVGELLATNELAHREETLYELEAGGFVIYTYDKPPVGPSRRDLSHEVDRVGGCTAEEVARWHPELGTVLGMPSSHHGIPEVLTVYRTWSDTQPPWGSVTINDGSPTTSENLVTLWLRASDPFPGSGVVEMRLRNGGDGPWMKWRKYATKTGWELSEGEGQKRVYVQFKDRAGNTSEPAKATIALLP